MKHGFLCPFIGKFPGATEHLKKPGWEQMTHIQYVSKSNRGQYLRISWYVNSLQRKKPKKGYWERDYWGTLFLAAVAGGLNLGRVIQLAWVASRSGSGCTRGGPDRNGNIKVIIKCHLLVDGQLLWISSCSDLPLFLHIHYRCVLTIVWCFFIRVTLGLPRPLVLSILPSSNNFWIQYNTIIFINSPKGLFWS